MKKALIAIASILAIVAGCAKNNIEKVADGKITATIESADTKATLNYGGSTGDNYLVWEAGDKILLMNADSRVEATLTGGQGTIYGQFDAESVPTGTYYAVYPAAAGNRFVSVEGDDSLFVEYPVHLTYNSETGNVENGGNIMIAQQSGSAIKFRNFCSYLNFTITGEETQKVSKIVLEARGEGYLAGQLFISDLESDEYYYENTDQASKTVDITFPDGEALSETGLSFNVALAPKCEYGFKATVYLTDGSYQELTSGEWWDRNKVIAMPAFAFSGKDVAEIGADKYKNLASAIAAANAATSDVTVTMLANASSNDVLSINNSSAKVTLDLNGKHVSAFIENATVFEIKDSATGGVITSNGATVKVLSGADFTLTGGTLESTSPTLSKEYDALRLYGSTDNPATATINGGNIVGGSSYAIYVTAGSVVFPSTYVGTVSGYHTLFITTSGEAIINAGNFVSPNSYSIYYGAKSGNCIINGGEFEFATSLGYWGYASGQMTINAGKFKGQSIVTGSSAGKYLTANLYAKGGLYSFSPDYVAPGYGIMSSTDPEYPYTIAESNEIFDVAGTKYTNFDDAINAVNNATSDVTITALQSMKLPKVIEFTNSKIAITLDLNSKILEAPEYVSKTADTVALAMNKASLNVTICDNSVAQRGMLSQSYTSTSYAIALNAGTLNITSGTVAQTSGAGYGRIAIMARGKSSTTTLNVSGGRIYGGRAIMMGSGNKDRKCYVNITGGWIQGLYDANSNYSPIGFRGSFGYLTIKGDPIIEADMGPAIYCGYLSCDIKIERDGEKIPFCYSNKDVIFSTGSGEITYFTKVDCYTNKVNVSAPEILSTSGATAHIVSPAIKDANGNSYTNHFYVE